MKRIIPVILSGGSGTRLWPLSREKTPKQFLKLLDGHTLLQRTVKRAQDILQDKKPEMIIVTLEAMRDETIRQVTAIAPALARHVLPEPEARNTAAAVAMAIQYAEKNFGSDVLLWLLPADHHIGNEMALREALFRAYDGAVENFIVTFGIEPTRAETGYGYIHKGQHLNCAGLHKINAFFEKPDHTRASQFFESGEYLWSSGMHLLSAETGRLNYQQHAPEIWQLVEQATGKSGAPHLTQMLYAKINKEPFETAVIEKAEKLAVVPCNPAWSDIGSWESLWEIKNKDDNGNALHGQALCEDTENSMILAHDRLVTCVGLKNVIVIETADSVLVADKACNGSLKQLVQRLQEKKREETIFSKTTDYEWGMERNIVNVPDTFINEIVLKPGRTLSGDIDHLASQIIVASGYGDMIIDGVDHKIGPAETISLTQDSTYSIHNTGDQMMKLYHLQFRHTAFQQDDLSLPAESTEQDNYLVA